MAALCVRFAALAGLVAAGLAGRGAAPCPAAAVELEVRPQDVGLEGHVRPGGWTAIQVRLTNRGARPRQVVCQWTLTDSDGDEPQYRRRVMLAPGGPTGLWLYAALPVGTNSRTRWDFAVLDAPGDEPAALLDRRVLDLDQGVTLLDQRQRVVGITGAQPLGLDDYATDLTQHEATMFIRGIQPRRLPDRWYGLALLQTLIWTPAGGSPDDPELSRATLAAIADWVQRGGHLVIVMPPAGDPWTGSLLAEILPDVTVDTLADQAQLPSWLAPLTPPDYVAHFRTFTPRPTSSGARVSILLADAEGHPLVVAASHGLGRVTWIGVDIADRRLQQRQIPSVDRMFDDGLWGRVLGWLSPAWPAWRIEQARSQGLFIEPHSRLVVDLGQFLPGQISMKRTAAPVLLLALALFVVYWLAAGPLGFAMLRRRNRHEHGWLLFVAVVGAFSVLSWAAAALLRPRQSRVEHLSVVDVRADTGEVRVHSWAALFVPRHRPAQVTLRARSDGPAAGTIASVGLAAYQEEGRFADPQRYEVACLAPDHMALPMRATSRRLELTYFGSLADASDGPLADWTVPNGPLEALDGELHGQLIHGLPAPLEQVRLMWCPGHGQTPRVRASPTWAPRQFLSFPPPPDAQWRPLVRRPGPIAVGDGGSDWKWQGHLGELAFGAGGQSQSLVPGATDLDDEALADTVEILGLFDALPPPRLLAENARRGMWQSQPIAYCRSQGRQIDLTALLATRCLIITGLLRDAPLPLPLRVDGARIVSRGWTMFRWICPVAGPGGGAAEDGP